MKTNPRPTLRCGSALGLVFLLLPTSLTAQSGTQIERDLQARQRVEQRLQAQEAEWTQQLQERLARVRAELAQVRETHQARQQEIQAELLAQMEALEQTLGVTGQLDQERILEQERRVRELRERARTLAAEREQSSRQRSESLRRQVEEMRVRAERDAGRMQQVVVRLRARVRLGVSLDPTQGAEVDRQGARIQSVMEESPAQEAGLKEGDIITHLDGRSLLAPIPQEGEKEFDPEESLPVQRLMALAADLEDGQEVEVRFRRDDQSNSVSLVARTMDEPMVMVSPGEIRDRIRTFRVRPGEGGVWQFEGPDDETFDFDLRVLPELRELDSLRVSRPQVRFFSPGEQELRGMVLPGGEGSSSFTFFSRSSRFGLELAELNPGLGEYFSADRGVLVLNVDEDSPTGLEPGDVILSIGGRSVDDEGDVVRILSSYEAGETVPISIVRKGRETTVEGAVR